METTVEESAEAAKMTPPRAPKGDDSSAPIRAKPFPEPPKSTIKHGTIPYEKFWGYRKALPKVFHDRLVFFVYREWPILDFYKSFTAEEIAEMRAHKKRRPIKYIAKYADIDPEDWRNHLLRFHGSGIYKILLNDVGVRGDKKLVDGAQVCSTTVELRDDEFPPVVDLAVLDMNDPANSSFINSLRMKGVNLPGDAPKEGTDDMATSVAVEALAELAKNKQPVESVTPVFSELLKQSEQRRIEDLKLLEVRHSREMADLKARLDKQEKSAEERPKESTTVQQVIEMARAIVPPPLAPPVDNKMVDVLMQLLKSTEERALQQQKLDGERHAREMDHLNKRLEAQEKRAADLETVRLQQLQNPVPSPGSASNSGTSSAIKDVLAVLKGVNELRSGIDGIAGEAGGGTGNAWVDLATELGPRVLDTISTVTTALRSTPATPQQQQQNPQVPGLPAIQQQQQVTALSAEEKMIERIKSQLLQALGQNMNGSMFGGGIMFEYGEPVYHYLSQLGESGLMAMLQQDGGYWGQIQQIARQVNIPQFVVDFLNGPAVIERAQAIRAGQGQRPTTVPQQPSVPVQQQRPSYPPVVDAVPASQVPKTRGRTIVREGGIVKTAPLVNGPVVDSNAT